MTVDDFIYDLSIRGVKSKVVDMAGDDNDVISWEVTIEDSLIVLGT